MQIYVKPMIGRRFTIDVEASDTIDNVKAKIKAHNVPPAGPGVEPGLPHEMQRLSFNRLKLEVGHRLSDYNIRHMDTIKLRWLTSTRAMINEEYQSTAD